MKKMLFFLCFGIFLLPGCGGSGPSIPVYPVKGTVKFADGKPVTAGFVEFVCQEGEGKGRNSNSKIAADGSFELESFDKGKGAYAGIAKVTVHPLPTEFNAEKGKEVPPEVSIPDKYKNYDTSGLQFTVDKKDNKFDIVIERK